MRDSEANQNADREKRGEVAVRNITKIYEASVAVSNASIHANPGEFISVIGPSGSGKTTVLMMIAGFTIPNSGEILLDGRDITRLTPQQRQLGMVFQNYAIFPHMTVHENVAFPLRVRRESSAAIEERVKWALETVQLGHLTHRYSRELSGGQQQRVALARAIVFHPRIILMDEPLGALDKNLRYHMQVELKDLQRKLGTTVIYVTHDQEEAMNMSDKIAVMNNGRVEQFGTPTELYERPTSRFVAKFLGEANLIPVTVAKNDGNRAAVSMPNGQSIKSVAIADPKITSEGQLFIRPEKLELCNQDNSDVAARLRGIVRRVSFLGNIVRYAVETGFPEELIIDRHNGSAVNNFSAGQAVSVAFDPEDALVLL
jgi:spermidine/putrescine ABC transporter ATP-binding subunit